MVNEQQQSLPIQFLPTIGTTIHLLDLEIGHDKDGTNSHLWTKIYHDLQTDEFELPNQYQYHTSQSSNLLKAALKHAVQCCSNENDFHDERRHLTITHLIRGFSSSFIDKYINEFYNEFDIKTDNCLGSFAMIPYQTLRQRVLDNYEQQQQEQQQAQNKKQNIIRVPYPDDWDAQMAINMKNDLLNMIKESLQDKQVLNDIEYELVPRPQTPLTMNDYLVDKRPPLCMLTLPTALDNEK